jgi:hypothetical protein
MKVRPVSTLTALMAMTLATSAAEPEITAVDAACPGLIAHITLKDYDGDHLLQLCVAPQGFSINGGVVTLSVYNNSADGIFHDSFEL